MQLDEFIREYERSSGYKLVFELWAKLQASMRSPCASLALLFMAYGKVARVKEEVGNTLDRCRAVVVEDDHADTYFRQEPISAVFKPLQSSSFIAI